MKSKIHREPSLGWSDSISVYEYDFMKSYLFAVYSHRVEDNELKIIRCLTHSPPGYVPLTPSSVDVGSDVMNLIGDSIFEVTLTYQGGLYDISLAHELLNSLRHQYFVYVLAQSENATDPKELMEYCKYQSLSNSYYKSKVLRITQSEYNNNDDIHIQPVVTKGKSLNDIFLSNECRDAIAMFIKTINNYKRIGKPLRYLLNGRPGTGKTETVRAIIEACRNSATFILVEDQCKLREVFDFASFFTPVVVCLDDIDLICGSRIRPSDSRKLGEFLGLMDGLNDRNVFALVTTNDRRWIDEAASRPGRFDMVLDFDILEPSYYLALIKQRCNNESLLDLFTEDVINRLQERKLSGAFVVNLLKHLEIRSMLDGTTINEAHVIEVMERMYKGFYKKSDVSKELIGFKNEG